ncbi:MAG: KH domain-containing protein [bacterium]|nr:KH domain-containing protein [bacterium]
MEKINKVNKVKVVEETAKEILSLMGSNASISVEEDKTNEAVLVKVNAGEETGLLIGKHGETLYSLQTITGMIVQQKMGEWTRVVVDVGDWKEKQDERLKSLADQIVEKTIESGQPQPIYNLTAGQRRVVHMALAQNKDVITHSEGEGEDRYLVVEPKTKK